jgi:hypothetical protein
MNLHQVNANRRAQARHDAHIRQTLLKVPDPAPMAGRGATMEEREELWARMDRARDRALLKLGCEVP